MVMNKFRAIQVGGAISISEINESGNVVRHVATIPEAAVPEFLLDIEQIKKGHRSIAVGDNA